MRGSCEVYLAPGAHTKSTKLCTLLSISSPPYAKDIKNLLPLVPHALSLQYYRDIAPSIDAAAALRSFPGSKPCWGFNTKFNSPEWCFKAFTLLRCELCEPQQFLKYEVLPTTLQCQQHQWPCHRACCHPALMGPAEDKGEAALAEHALQQAFFQSVSALAHRKKLIHRSQSPFQAETLKWWPILNMPKQDLNLDSTLDSPTNFRGFRASSVWPSDYFYNWCSSTVASPDSHSVKGSCVRH